MQTIYPVTRLYLDLMDYKDLHVVRGLTNLSDDLVARIKQNCPDDVVRKGIDAVLKYLEPARERLNDSGS